VIYRIYTEDKNGPALDRLLQEHVDGYTRFQGAGFWRDKAGRVYCEESLVIELVDATEGQVEAIAEGIKSLNHQQAVLVVSFEAQARFF
jgi:hypothetical protein